MAMPGGLARNLLGAGDFSFPSAGWADYIDLQAGVSAVVDHARVHDLGLENRQRAAKPMIQEEFCMGDETDAERRMLWAAFTSGAAGSGTGAYLKPFSQFVPTVRFERMAPADSLVVTGSAYALAEEGSPTWSISMTGAPSRWTSRRFRARRAR